MANQHIMHHDDAPYAAIAAGKKTMELRVNDVKRQGVKVNDTIQFVLRSDKTKTLLVRVTERVEAPTFDQLVKQTPAARLGVDAIGAATLALRLNRAYGPAEQKQFGCVGLGFSLLSAS